MRFLADKIKEARKQKNWTQSKLAEVSNVSVSTIKKLESMVRVKQVDSANPNLQRICQALELDVHSLFLRDCHVISIQSHKGGTGKTTFSLNFAYTLVNTFKKRVLLIDCDAQMNLTRALAIKATAEQNFNKAFVNEEPLTEHIRHTEYPGLDIVTSHHSLAGIDMNIFLLELKEFRMRNILKSVKEEGLYDYIIVDCAPAINQLNKSILYGSDYIIVPLELSDFGYDGLIDIYDFYKSVHAKVPHLELLGLAIPRYTPLESASAYIYSQVEETFANKADIFEVKIPKDTNISKSQILKQPIGVTYRRSRANLAYIKLTELIINKIENSSKKEMDVITE